MMERSLAIVVSPNGNLNSVDTWALVKDGAIVNTLLASTADINQSIDNHTSLFTSNDYVVDLTIQGQNAGPGWTYDSEGNTFIGPTPPEINWIDIVHLDFTDISQSLLSAINNFETGALSEADMLSAYTAAIQDNQSNFTANQAALMNSIYNFVKSGG